jgi:hypothetical protein
VNASQNRKGRGRGKQGGQGEQGGEGDEEKSKRVDGNPLIEGLEGEANDNEVRNVLWYLLLESTLNDPNTLSHLL